MQVLFSLAHSQTSIFLPCRECLPVNFAEVLDNLGSLEGVGGSVCEEQRESPIESLWWFPGFHVSSLTIPTLISFFFFLFSLGIYITVLDFIMSMSSHLYFSQSDIVFTYYEER